MLDGMSNRARIESALAYTTGLNEVLLEAACIGEDPEVFFPEGRERPVWEDIERAKAICRTCPVVDACRDWAVAMRIESGIWGGLTEAERQRVGGRPGRRSTRPYLSVLSSEPRNR
jgi:WhiB family transcriptional regulator, redox-sensing transcriptional regulator